MAYCIAHVNPAARHQNEAQKRRSGGNQDLFDQATCTETQQSRRTDFVPGFAGDRYRPEEWAAGASEGVPGAVGDAAGGDGESDRSAGVLQHSQGVGAAGQYVGAAAGK